MQRVEKTKTFRTRSMHVPIYVSGRTEQALIDSGATGCFIDKSYVIKHEIPTIKLEKPLHVRNINNTENVAGKVVERVVLPFSLGGRTETREFYVTELSKQAFILGLPWLVATNPDINWRTRKVQYREGPILVAEDDAEEPTYNLAISFVKGEATEETRQQWNKTRMNKASLFAYEQNKEHLQDMESKTLQQKVPVELHVCSPTKKQIECPSEPSTIIG